MEENINFLLKLLSFNGNNIDYKPDIECVRFCSQELEKLGFDCDFQIFGNVRFFQETGEQVIEKIKKVCNDICADCYTISTIIEREGYETDKNSAFIKMAMNIMKDYNEKSDFNISRGVSDGEYIKRICPIVCELGLKGKLAHKPNEYTTKQDMTDLQYIYEKIIVGATKLLDK